MFCYTSAVKNSANAALSLGRLSDHKNVVSQSHAQPSAPAAPLAGRAQGWSVESGRAHGLPLHQLQLPQGLLAPVLLVLVRLSGYGRVRSLLLLQVLAPGACAAGATAASSVLSRRHFAARSSSSRSHAALRTSTASISSLRSAM